MTFDRILKGKGDVEAPLVRTVRNVMSSLEGMFGMPVDIEFAVDSWGDEPVFHLVQVRPLGATAAERRVEIPGTSPDGTLLRCGNVLGHGVLRGVKKVLYVPAESYGPDDSNRVIRSIREMNARAGEEGYILIGPGRWGTTNPALGIPVDYGGIFGAVAIVELSGGEMTPEFSYGTHFFSELVSSKTFYLPLYPDRGDTFNVHILERASRIAGDDLVRLIDIPEGLEIHADGESRRALVRLRPSGGS